MHKIKYKQAKGMDISAIFRVEVIYFELMQGIFLNHVLKIKFNILSPRNMIMRTK